MVVIEYLGGLPRRERAVAVDVTVQAQTLRFKHGRLLGSWTQQIPLTTIDAIEITTAEALRAAGQLPASSLALLGQPQECLLAIALTTDTGPTAVILRGSWAVADQLRQEVLKGRMRAAKQWHS